MRIISGKYKSRKINSDLSLKEDLRSFRDAVKNDQAEHRSLRPTTDRARESLFNILNNFIDFEKLKCLDLFAGTGAVGFELLSRGAESVSFVDSSPRQVKLMGKTAEELDCVEQIEIFSQSVPAFLSEHKGEFYDLVFADPPYNYKENDKWLGILPSLKFNVFVIEYGSPGIIDFEFKGFQSMTRKTGITNFKIYLSES